MNLTNFKGASKVIESLEKSKNTRRLIYAAIGVAALYGIAAVLTAIAAIK